MIGSTMTMIDTRQVPPGGPVEPDRELREALARGDHRAAAHSLVTRFADEMYRFCVSSSGSRQDGEDLAQEVLGEACRSLPRFRGQSSVRTWLYRVAWHKILDYRKRLARQPILVPIDGAQTNEFLRITGNQEEALVTARRRKQVARAFARMSTRDRMVLSLRVDLELSYHEIAGVLGVRTGAAKMRMNRAVERLRTEVGP
jgi:RNA polymerase sigma-70 factor, ECF subfamily